MKKLTALLFAGLLLSVSACGAGEDDEAAKSISDSLVKNSEDSESITSMNREDADCIGEGMVDGVGVDQLKEYGLLEDSGEVNKGVTDIKMSKDDAESVTDTFFDCTDIMATMKKSIGDVGADDPEVQSCVEDALSEDAVRSMLESTFTGDQEEATKAIQEPMMKCMTPAAG